MITYNQFVSIETAQNLKELGFTDEIYTYYDKDDNLIHSTTKDNWNNNDDLISAPNLFETSEWLLKTHSMFIEVFPEDGASFEQNKFVYDWIIWKNSESYHKMTNITGTDAENNPWTAMEMAILEAINIIKGTPTELSDEEILEKFKNDDISNYSNSIDIVAGHNPFI